jgi:hypothetical protein
MVKKVFPTHTNSVYGERISEFDIRNGEELEGDLPDKAKSLVQEWMKIHKDELLDIWNSQNFRNIEGLE